MKMINIINSSIASVNICLAYKITAAQAVQPFFPGWGKIVYMVQACQFLKPEIY